MPGTMAGITSGGSHISRTRGQWLESRDYFMARRIVADSGNGLDELFLNELRAFVRRFD